MQALILAGGSGTRLRPYTTVLPKPLMPVGDKPILEILLRQLRHAGVEEVFLAVGYLSHLIQAVVGDGQDYGMRVRYSHETQPLGTAGPIALVIDQLRDDFLVMNGDLLTTVSFRRLFEFHRQAQAAATIGLYGREVPIDFGVIEMDADQRLVTYIEKPTYRFDVSMGINALNAQIVRSYVKLGERLDLPDLMLRLQRDGHPVFCYREACYWLDIGRAEDYQTANEIFEARRAEFLVDDGADAG